jgi:uncharacterized RDD family membrane protein YckC
MPPASDSPEFEHLRPVAGLGRRLGAMLYDSLLLIAVWMVTGFAVVAANRFQAVSGAWFQTLLFLEAYAFFAFFWLRDGQTLGMRAWRLRLVTKNHSALTLNQATVRMMVALLSYACLGLGYWWCLIDRRGYSWSDLASNTQVVVDAPYRDQI